MMQNQGKTLNTRSGSARKKHEKQNIGLRMIAVAEASLKDEAKILWQEAKELNLIFNAITNKINKKKN